jgi:hypothetical protein
VLDTLRGAVATQLLQPGSEVVSLFHRRLEHGYPTPSLGRDAVLEQALPWLQQAAGIWSRGRFGSYKVRTVHSSCCLIGPKWSSELAIILMTCLVWTSGQHLASCVC